MKAVVIAVILCLGVGWLQPREPDWLEFQEMTIVRYHPGAKWRDFGKPVEGHLAFLRKQMEAGKMLYAGPFADDSGGLNIYAVTNLEEVDRLVRQDPAVANGAVTFSMQVWNMSKLVGEEAGTARRDLTDGQACADARGLTTCTPELSRRHAGPRTDTGRPSDRAVRPQSPLTKRYPTPSSVRRCRGCVGFRSSFWRS